MTDAAYMERALALAERGRGRTSPNPMVGAVVVSPDGVVVGAGYHRRAGEPHAEVHALAAAGDRARGATLYCTLEPCCHTGRTGPCVARIVEAGVSRVVAAIRDPNPLVNGGGIRYLQERGVAVTEGVGAEAAARLNEGFLTVVTRGRPFVTMKVAVSLDGRVAAESGRRTRLTSEAALRQVHLLRAEVDAIAVGSGTVLADDPLLTAREAYRAHPLTRVVFDTRLRTPALARVLSTLEAGPVIIVTSEAAVAEAPASARALASVGATLQALPRRDVGAAVTWLGSLGITTLLLEGGTTLHAAAWAAGIVDRVQVYVAPVVLGERGVRWVDAASLSMAALRDLRVEPCGADVFIEGYVHRTR